MLPWWTYPLGHRHDLIRPLALCLYFYIIFDQRRVDIIDKVELWSPRQVTHLPPVWDVLLPLA